MLTRLTLALIIAVSLTTAVGFVIVPDAWPLTLVGLALGGLWVLAHRRQVEGLASFLLVCFIALAGVGIGFAYGPIWAPPVVVLALAAWDLGRFTARLQGPADETRELEHRHLRRLLVVSGLGLGLAWLALSMRLQLGFAVALGLGFLAVLGLSQVIRALARESD